MILRDMPEMHDRVLSNFATLCPQEKLENSHLGPVEIAQREHAGKIIPIVRLPSPSDLPTIGNQHTMPRASTWFPWTFIGAVATTRASSVLRD